MCFLLFILIFGIFCLIASFIMLSTGGTGFGIFFLLLGIVVSSVSIKFIVDDRQEKAAEEEAQALSNKINFEAKALRAKYDQVDFSPVTFKSGLNVLIGVVSEKLIIIPHDNNTHANRIKSGIKKVFEIIIPFQNIQYYLQTGEITSKVSGYGGNSSFSVMTGFHGKINPVSISTSIVDNKQTQLYYSVDGKGEMIAFMYDDFHKIKKLLPKYDYSVVISKEIQSSKTRENFSTQFEDRLNNLLDLKSKGLLTEDEYQKKRKQIIDNI
ncbi:MAG: SHOCT domain-containing protein [Saccharofermentanales bacterium]|jgi:hypothetical protein